MLKAELFYKKYFNIESPYEHQISLWNRIHAMELPLLLKAPTGSGKTESVLALFLSQFIDNNFHIAPRMIYVLPMRVLVNSVAQRIRKYTQKISTYISVEVQHGDVPNSPFFIADIVVTTLDQFLYGFARASGQVGRHLDIPAGSIASSIVVFDEAHMYRDGFTFSIMRALMEILNKSHIKRAQKIYEIVKDRLELDDEQIVLLHSRFTKADRKSHEEKAIALIPHKEDRKVVIPEGAGIAVSTQVLEAGLTEIYCEWDHGQPAVERDSHTLKLASGKGSCQGTFSDEELADFPAKVGIKRTKSKLTAMIKALIKENAT